MASMALGETKVAREMLRVMNAGQGDNGQVRRIFDRFDVDGNGCIDALEFIPFAQEVAKEMLRTPQGTAQYTMTSAVAACYEVLKQVDANHDGKLQWEEFWNFVSLPGRFSAPKAATNGSPSPSLIRENREKRQFDRYENTLSGKAGPVSSSLGGSAVVAPGSGVELPPSLDRREILRQVFGAFDIDNNGFITDNELLLLGKARRELGQKQGEWTTEMNRTLMTRIDTDGDGRIKEIEFTRFFDDFLPRNSVDFERNVAQFFKVASAVRKGPFGSSAAPAAALRSRAGAGGGSSMIAEVEPGEPLSPPSSRGTYRERSQPASRQSTASSTARRGDLLSGGDGGRNFGMEQGSDQAVARANQIRKEARERPSRSQSSANNRSPTPPRAASTSEGWLRPKSNQAPRGSGSNSKPPAFGTGSRDELAAIRAGGRASKPSTEVPGTSSGGGGTGGSGSDPQRRDALLGVFAAFDLDRNGTVGPDEMFQLGTMRRELGQKQGEWTRDMNMRLFRRIDADGDGKLQREEFVQFFEKSLPVQDSEFRAIIRAFLDCARKWSPSKQPRSSLGPEFGSLLGSSPRGDSSMSSQSAPSGRVGAMKAAIAELGETTDLPASTNQRTSSRVSSQSAALVTRARETTLPVTEIDGAEQEEAGPKSRIDELEAARESRKSGASPKRFERSSASGGGGRMDQMRAASSSSPSPVSVEEATAAAQRIRAEARASPQRRGYVQEEASATGSHGGSSRGGGRAAEMSRASAKQTQATKAASLGREVTRLRESTKAGSGVGAGTASGTRERSSSDMREAILRLAEEGEAGGPTSPPDMGKRF